MDFCRLFCVNNYCWFGMNIRMVEIKETESENRELVKGLHEAIVLKDLFQKVQDVLDGRKPSIKKVNNLAEI